MRFVFPNLTWSTDGWFDYHGPRFPSSHEPRITSLEIRVKLNEQDVWAWLKNRRDKRATELADTTRRVRLTVVDHHEIMAAEWRGAYNILKEDFPITRLERTAYKVSNQGLIHRLNICSELSKCSEKYFMKRWVTERPKSQGNLKPLRNRLLNQLK